MARFLSALRSERLAALLLLGAAVVGLVVANTAAGASVIAVREAHLAVPWLGLDLSLGHWVSDGLLAIFFFVVAVELKRELAIGDLSSPARAALPAIAAAGGIVVPALVFLAFTKGTPEAVGWPIPTATDIAFALGVLAVFGRFIPTRVRVFLLALAVLDDLVAILVIAFFFTEHVAFGWLGGAAVAVAAFGAVSRLLRARSPYRLARRPVWPVVAVLVVLGIAAWVCTVHSGVHSTIAGVALGFSMSRRPGGRAAHALEPWSNGVVLPLFAFTAALVAVPQVEGGGFEPAFWGILVGLPVGKFVGITLAASIGVAIARRRAGADPGAPPALAFGDLAMVGVLGGVGFTVSLLMNELAFEAHPVVADEGTLAVLAGSGLAIVASAVVVAVRSARYRRRGAAPGDGGALSR